jgi:hypothetical protein
LGRILTLKYFFCCKFLLSQKKITIFLETFFREKDSPPLDTNFKFWAVFCQFPHLFTNFMPIDTKSWCKCYVKKMKEERLKKMLNRNALVLGGIKGITILSTLDTIVKYLNL